MIYCSPSLATHPGLGLNKLMDPLPQLPLLTRKNNIALVSAPFIDCSVLHYLMMIVLARINRNLSKHINRDFCCCT